MTSEDLSGVIKLRTGDLMDGMLWWQYGQHQHQELVLRETFEKVERAKQEWEATLDALPELICLVDAQGRVLRANRTLERWCLGHVKTVKNQDLHTLLHADCSASTCELKASLHQAREQARLGQAPPVRNLRSHFGALSLDTGVAGGCSPEGRPRDHGRHHP